jgi:hypothetical protein
VLIDGTVEIGSLACDLQVRLIGEPPVTGCVTARLGGFDELRSEPLHLPVDRNVIHRDAAFGQQFLDVPVGQAVPQVPPDGDRDHLRRDRKLAKTEVARCAVT